MNHIKQLLFTGWFLLFSVAAFATNPPGKGSLSGVVKDDHGNTLIGVIIQIPDLKMGTTSDTDGNYTIDNIPNGKYVIEVKQISFSNLATTVTVNGATTHDFTLTESAIEGKEVIVTGQSKATEIRRSPVPIVAINSQYLKENFSANIIDAIAKIPGVTAVTTGPNVSKPFIRGLGYNRVLTLYNGMRQEGQQWGDEHGIEVDEYNVDRIEVIKGPASLIYGSDALAGVVNLIPTPPPTIGKTEGGVALEYQGNNNMLGGTAFVGGNQNGASWLVRGSRKIAGNYQNAIDGRVYGTSFAENDFSASLGINKHWGFSHLDVSLFNDKQAIPDGSRDSATRQFTKQITEADTLRPIVPASELNGYGIPVLHQLVQHYRVQSSNSFNVGEGKLALTLGFQRNVRREFSHPEAAETAGLYLQLNSYTYDVKYYFADFKGIETTIGINGMYQTNDATQGTEFIIPSYHQFDIGPFILLKKSFGNLDISGGARFDSRAFHGDAMYTKTDPTTGFDQVVTGANTAGADQPFNTYDHTFSGLTYSLGLAYKLNDHFSMKANVARGFRAPNISEISANGVHPGTNIYQLGNPDFKPEFSLQEDLGIEMTTQHVSGSFSVFNNSISNYIYNQKVRGANGQDSIIISGNQTFQFQATKAQLYGAELDIDIHPHPFDWLHFENSISLVYGVNKGNGQALSDSEKYLPFIPPLHGISELRADLKHPSKRLKNFFAKVQLQYYAAQNRAYLAYNTETTTPGCALLNAGIGTDIVSKKRRTLFNISVFANNILNTSYQDHLSRLKYFEQYPDDPRGHSGIYNMGRNIGLKLSVPLSFKFLDELAK